MTGRLAVTLVVFALASPGCGWTVGGWEPYDTVEEERAWLRSLSNPTPADRERIKQLDEIAKATSTIEAAKDAREGAEVRARLAAEKARADAWEVDVLMRRGAAFQRSGHREAASRAYKAVSEGFPDSPRAAEAKQRQTSSD